MSVRWICVLCETTSALLVCNCRSRVHVFEIDHLSHLCVLPFALAVAAKECACTTDGLSGGVQTNVRGCTRHQSFTNGTVGIEAYCYLNGGAAR
jgi:hypothetical protein